MSWFDPSNFDFATTAQVFTIDARWCMFIFNFLFDAFWRVSFDFASCIIFGNIFDEKRKFVNRGIRLTIGKLLIFPNLYFSFRIIENWNQIEIIYHTFLSSSVKKRWCNMGVFLFCGRNFSLLFKTKSSSILFRKCHLKVVYFVSWFLFWI